MTEGVSELVKSLRWLTGDDSGKFSEGDKATLLRAGGTITTLTTFIAEKLDSQAAELTRLRELVALAEKALEPFAEVAEVRELANHADSYSPLASKPNMGHFRAARLALTKLQASHEE